MDLFSFIANRINLNKMRKESAEGLIRNPENESIVNRRLLNLIDTECVYIKNMVQRRIENAKGITEKTKDYIFSKCENDPCYVVRMVCEEEKAKRAEET